MGEIININKNEVNLEKNEDDLITLTKTMIGNTRATIDNKNTLSVPIAELATLGAGVSSLIPALNTEVHTTTIATEGLYQIANADAGDMLKVAKNGNFWGSFKTPKGASKFAQLKEAGPISVTTKKVSSINPATMMMAVALFSIEKDLGKIADMEKQILSFLEIENESEIEADVETLINIVNKYKFNWDNEHYVSSNHKLVLDIRRTARKNMNAYQKKINEILNNKHYIVVQGKVKSVLSDLEKNSQYYRLSLYTFSLASMMEIMLSGNVKEEYISEIRDEIKSMSKAYRDLFRECSLKLEAMGNSALESNVVKGIGSFGKISGTFIGKIKLIKEGAVDEFLQDIGEKLHNTAYSMESKAIKSFASLGNPRTSEVVEKMDDMIQIYNHTAQIRFDNENIYLLA